MNSSDFRQEARKKLEGKWGKAVLIILAYALIYFVIGFVEGLFPEFARVVLSILVMIIEIPLGFGMISSLLKLYNGEEVKPFDFLNLGFNNFGRSWSVTFQTILKMLVPVILIIVSYILIAFGIASSITSMAYSTFSSSSAAISTGVFGILSIIGLILLIISMIWAITKSYYYQLSYIIAAENPDISGKDAVLKSEELMQNKRGKLFSLQLSFIGWAILALFTFYIGYLWLMPYIQFAIISFYKNSLGQTVEPKKEIKE